MAPNGALSLWERVGVGATKTKCLPNRGATRASQRPLREPALLALTLVIHQIVPQRQGFQRRHDFTSLTFKVYTTSTPVFDGEFF